MASVYIFLIFFVVAAIKKLLKLGFQRCGNLNITLLNLKIN